MKLKKEERERKLKALTEKIEKAKDVEELRELQIEYNEVRDAEIEEEITEKEERSLLNNQNIEERNLANAKEIEKTEKLEERNNNYDKLAEERGQALKEGKAIKVGYEDRAVTVSNGSLLTEKKYKRNINESFEGVSGIVDKLNSIQLDGGDSYEVPFEKTYGEGDYTGEAEDYKDTELEVDYVNTGRAKITAYSEISKEATKLPNTKYQALVIKRVKDSIRKKLGKQSIAGAGTSNTIKGIYNADEKVLPKTDDTADIELEKVDINTLNKIVFAYGGDESVEGEQELILSKKDLEEFSMVKDKMDNFVYKITRNGQTGRIGYAKGGVEVPYTINSACNSLSNTDTESGKFTMVYGNLEDFELPVFSPLEIEESRDYKFKQGIICYRGDVIVGGTVSRYKGFVRIKKKTTASV